MNRNFNIFEDEVMHRLIEEKAELSNILLKQYNNATVVNRKFTGVGFFTDFEISDKSLIIREPLNFEFGSVQAETPHLQHGIGFILFIRNGFIDFLEGYTYGEPFPTDFSSYHFI